jgi:DNA-binding ferritin-like protein (Dps family)
MIWFRRISTIPLIVIFVVLLIVLLPVSQLNDTAGNPEYYKAQIREADLYNFIYDEVLPAGLDELETGALSDVPIDIYAIKDDVVSISRKILPPDWLQAQVESAIDTIIPYFLGDTDSFTYTIVLRDRIDIAASVIKDDIIRGSAFTDIYDDAVSYLADELLDNMDKTPYELTLSREEIEAFFRNVFPEDWLALQAEAAIDSVTPYLTGDSSHFTITVNIANRVDAASLAILDLLDRQETYDYLLYELITQSVEANLGLPLNLPYGISLSREEINSAIEETLPHSWVQAQLNDIVDAATAYLKGDAPDIEVTVDLADTKADTLDALTSLADEKLENLFYNLPVCSMWEFYQIIQTLPPETLPDCQPSGVSYQEVKDALGIDIAGMIDQMVVDQIPDQWVFTDTEVRQLLGEDIESFLEDVRGWVSEGWTFTDVDLMDELDSDDEQTWEDVRGWIKSGYIFTESDLREAIADNEQDLSSFDTARGWIGTARAWLWALWLIAVVLLIFIGLLGGRCWRTRLVWALAVLFFTSLVIYIATGVVYSRVEEPITQGLTLDPSHYGGLAAVVVEKGNEIIENVLHGSDGVSGFTQGIKTKALYIMITSGVCLLGIACWSELRRRMDKGVD